MKLCSKCRRFSRSSACPFCGAETMERASPNRAHVSRATLILAGALATQCQCKQETIAQPYGAPPNPQPVIQDDAGANAGDAGDAGLPPLPKP